MKNIFIVVLLLLFSLSLFSQEISQMRVIGNATYLTDKNIDKNVVDKKGNKCAVLLIQTDLTGLSYNSKNRIVKIVPDIKSTLLYLTSDETVVQIYKQGFLPLEINLSEYGIKLESGSIWQIMIAEKLKNNLLPVKINISPTDVALFIDNELKVPASVYPLNSGEHKIVIQRNGYEVLLDTINVNEESLSFAFELKSIDKSGNSIIPNVTNEMIFVEGGSFEMGNDDFGPVHKVTVSDFFISKYEVTFDEYDKFCEATGKEKPYDEDWERGRHPVINITWDDAKAYCEWAGGRLPTEAEWEYAARGGASATLSHKYSGSDNIDDVAWYDDNSNDRTKAVGKKQPNELGIYDMSGNVWEWCNDWFDDDYYSESPDSNPKGPEDGSFRVLRGGSWYEPAYACNYAYRFAAKQSKSSGTIGFRLVIEVK